MEGQFITLQPIQGKGKVYSQGNGSIKCQYLFLPTEIPTLKAICGNPPIKAGQIYGEASGREAERWHLKTISNSFPSGVRQGRTGGMNQPSQLPLKTWASVKVELCLKSQDSTASLLLDRDFQRSHSSSVPCFGKC